MAHVGYSHSTEPGTLLPDLFQSSHVLSERVSLKTNADTLCSPSQKWVMVVSQPPGIQVTVTPADSRVITASPGGGRKQGPCSSSWSLQTGCERSSSPSGRGPGPGSQLLFQGLALQDPLSLGLVLLAESITWCSPASRKHNIPHRARRRQASQCPLHRRKVETQAQEQVVPEPVRDMNLVLDHPTTWI